MRGDHASRRSGDALAPQHEVGGIIVFAGLVPAIHAVTSRLGAPPKEWMPGTSPGMTVKGKDQVNRELGWDARPAVQQHDSGVLGEGGIMAPSPKGTDLGPTNCKTAIWGLDIAALLRCLDQTGDLGITVVGSTAAKHELHAKLLEASSLREAIELLRGRLAKYKELLSA